MTTLPAGDRFSLLAGGLWTLFLIFPAMDMVQRDSQPLASRLLALAVLVVFGALHCLSFYWVGPNLARLRPKVLVLLAELGLAVVALALMGSAAVALSPYIVSYVTFCFPVGLGASLAVGILAPLGLTLLVRGAPWTLWSMFMLAVIIGATGVATTLLTNQEKRVAELQRRQALLQERDRLGRDVHDLLGHSLTVVGLKTQLVERLLETDPARARAELSSIRAITAEALDGVRQTVNDQRPAALATELAVATSSLSTAGLEVELDGDPADCPPELGPVLAWVVREASTNVLRHAGAQRVRVSLGPEHLVFEDDGSGTVSTEGNGIRGMRQRVGATGGRLEIGSSPLGGTRVGVSW